MINLLAMAYEMKLGLSVAAIIIGVSLVLFLGLGAALFFMALGHQTRPDPKVPCKGSLFERNADNENLKKGYKWFDTTYNQEVTIKNRDGLNLHGIEFRNPSNSDVWAICLHGWTNVTREMSGYAMEFYKRGFNILLPDLRGHQKSESKYITMGWLDRLDVVDWIENLVSENPKAQVIIMGVSMGGATTMMTTGEKLPKNVVLAIEDCGFTSAYDIFVDQCKRSYHLPPKIAMPAANIVNIIFNKFSFKKASAVEQLKKSVTPTLFIHGDKDDFVLPDNLDKVYAACAAPKEKYVVKGAEHALSSHCYHEEYWEVVDSFLAKYFDVVDA